MHFDPHYSKVSLLSWGAESGCKFTFLLDLRKTFSLDKQNLAFEEIKCINQQLLWGFTLMESHYNS